MKKSLLIVACAGLCLCGALAGVALGSDPIKAEHRMCMKDDDCALIPIGCTLPCVGKGRQDTVNKNYVELYKYLGHCTDDEISKASAIQCAYVSGYVAPSAICQKNKCVMKDNNN